MMEIRQQLITSLFAVGKDSQGNALVNPTEGITIHETANKAVGADARGHANYQSALLRKYNSWQWQVDDHEAVQSYENNRVCWHAGDGMGFGNTKSIAIEICVNSDGNFSETVENAAELTAKLMAEEGIPLSRVKQHHDYSSYGKNCPTTLRSGVPFSWDNFIDMVEAKYTGTPISEINAPKATSPRVIAEDGWWGRGTTMSLQIALGTPRDSVISNQNVLWQPLNLGLTSGWDWQDPYVATSRGGSTCLKAVQAWSGVPRNDRDGIAGPQTFSHIQTKLRAMGLYSGVIDGEFWRRSPTIKALQSALNQGLI